MFEDDTIKLLRETNAGAKMGIESLEDLQKEAENEGLKEVIRRNIDTAKEIAQKTEDMLRKSGDEDKDVNPIAKGMSWVKTNMKLAMEHDDKMVASLVTDGCDMGTKTLMRYMNQYAAASKEAKALAKDLLESEEHLRMDVRCYL